MRLLESIGVQFWPATFKLVVAVHALHRARTGPRSMLSSSTCVGRHVPIEVYTEATYIRNGP